MALLEKLEDLVAVAEALEHVVDGDARAVALRAHGHPGEQPPVDDGEGHARDAAERGEALQHGPHERPVRLVPQAERLEVRQLVQDLPAPDQHLRLLPVVVVDAAAAVGAPGEAPRVVVAAPRRDVPVPRHRRALPRRLLRPQRLGQPVHVIPPRGAGGRRERAGALRRREGRAPARLDRDHERPEERRRLLLLRGVGGAPARAGGGGEEEAAGPARILRRRRRAAQQRREDVPSAQLPLAEERVHPAGLDVVVRHRRERRGGVVAELRGEDGRGLVVDSGAEDGALLGARRGGDGDEGSEAC